MADGNVDDTSILECKPVLLLSKFERHFNPNYSFEFNWIYINYLWQYVEIIVQLNGKWYCLRLKLSTTLSGLMVTERKFWETEQHI